MAASTKASSSSQLQLNNVISNQNTLAGKTTIANPGKNLIIHRTRNALGEIGNRLTNKGSNGEGTRDLLAKKGVVAGLARKGSTKLQRSQSGAAALLKQKTKVLTRSQTIRGRGEKDTTAAEAPKLVTIAEGFITAKKEQAIVKPLNTAAENKNGKSGTVVKQATATTTKEQTVSETDVEKLTEAFSSKRFTIQDIDAKDTSEFMMKVYAKDIDAYLFQLEKLYRIKEDYLKDRSVNSRMRAVLMDWIVDVHNQFSLCQETLYLAQKCLDRFLQVEQTASRNQLQLIGVTALYIAVKFEEVYMPAISDFSGISDNSFSTEDLRKMEIKMLKALGFDVSSPVPVHFLRRIARALNADILVYVMSKFFMELTIVDYTVCHLHPSMIASASIALAVMVVNKAPISKIWNPTLVYYSRYSLENLKSGLKFLVGVVTNAFDDETNKCQAIRRKYAKTKFQRISALPEIHPSHWKTRVMNQINEI